MSGYSEWHHGGNRTLQGDYHRGLLKKSFEMPEGDPITRQMEYRDYLIVQDERQLWKVTAKDGRDVPGIAGLFTKVHLAEDAIERHYSDIERTKHQNDKASKNNN